MTPVEPLLRGVLVTALMVLVGAPPVFGFAVFPELARRGLDTAPAARVARGALVWTLLVALASGAGLAAVRAGGIGALGGWSVGTAAGGAWVALTAVGVGLIAVTVARRSAPDALSRRRWLCTVLVGGSAMLLAFCWTRYSSAVDSAALAISVKFLHMLSAAVWVGGLGVLAALPRLVPGEGGDDAASVAAALVRRFSLLAVAAVTVAFVTGVLIVTWHVPSAVALVTTPYGLALSLKVLLVLGAAGLGGFNRFVVHQHLQHAGREGGALPGLAVFAALHGEGDAVASLVRAVRLELAVLLAVVAVSVLLTSTFAPSYEALSVPAPTAGALLDVGRQTTDAAFDAVFRSALEFGAIGIALLGSLTLGYELGEFSVRRQ
ncbi:CopD family protein [Halomarina litorea]|uniref:CopD family protein n=1 Tax=Halomarina litorea TaxID=2961595 RepID=UPI0020C48961|nr:CopD family protein [Halomarina sp. BCD28]